jgi:hypothetical protein
MENQFYSLGKICEHLQMPIGWLQTAINEIGLKPALVLNDVQYFTTADETAIFEFHRKRAIERIEKCQKTTQ